MRNKKLVRIQLLLLIAVIGLILWRGKTGLRGTEGVIVFEGMSSGELYRAGLQVDQATSAIISVVAAYENNGDMAALATYGWILESESRNLIWSTDQAKLIRDGVLGETVDTIHIAPGSYEVFYTTLGPTENSIEDAPFLGLTPYWTNYESSWSMSIRELETGTNSGTLIRTSENRSKKMVYEKEFWTTGPVSSRGTNPFWFRILRRVKMNVYAVGQMCSPNCDYGWIEDARSGEKVWVMEWENTVPAGGAKTNRMFNGVLDLSPGVYRAVYRSYGSHSVSNWNANPPYNPDGWGITLFGVNEADAEEFDPWVDSEPFILLTEIGNSKHEMIQFAVSDTINVLISALGEITTRGALWDYGWLEDNDSGELLWEMSRENSLPAGGDRTNRVETAFLDLAPGEYTIHYRTDAGHAFGHWSLTKPSNPNRWGVALFAIDHPTEMGGLRILHSTREPDMPYDAAVEDPRGASNLGEALVLLERVGNDADLYDTFVLDSDQEVYIVAQGEISTGGRWDYGWIESSSSGERIWELTLRNTTSAGGADRNRRFEGWVSLKAGSFTARFRSDLSHAYDDFGDEAPEKADEWGMRIFRRSH
ncbi:MAG: hypothetical protein IH853_03950 [Bacteroidetes bacterium]|nr:hypothetical protein [Bacteroidota bacterium]MCH8246296.1 hypothetical protein [Bacteroidota bacterium]